MRKLSCVTLLGAVLGLLVFGCEKAPNPTAVPLSDQSGVESLSKAATFTTNTSIPINDIVFVPCAAGGAGEDVQLSGTFHVLTHVTLDGSGGFHGQFHVQAQGVSGVGLTTGDKYQGSGVQEEKLNGQVGFEVTLMLNYRIIGQGSGNNLLVHQTLHVTVNANGGVTAFVDNSRIECR